MAIKSLFPEEMMESNASSGLTLEIIGARLSYFVEQIHLIHFQTTSFAEHQALGGLYDKVFDLQDEIIEKIMGYSNRRIKAYKIEPLRDNAPGYCNQIVNDLISFAKALEEFGEQNNMPDIENIAQSLSGEASQTKYRLTLT